MKTKLFVTVLAVFVCSGAGWPKIYKVTDKKYGVVFTDRPDTVDSKGHEQTIESIKLGETNTADHVDVPPPPPPTPASEEPAIEAEVTIVSPTDETTIAMGPGNFNVSASTTPPLTRGEQLVLMMDGEAYGDPQKSGNWFVEGAIRGPHDLTVQRTGARGKVLATSEPVRVYVLRPSIIRY